jgi:hypothetical protein
MFILQQNVLQYEHKRNTAMTMTEPQIDPGMAEEVKDHARELRGDQTSEFDLPAADQAPDPTAPAEMTAEDEAGMARLDAAPEAPVANPSEHIIDLTAADKVVPLDESMQANLNAKTSGDQASRLMEEIKPAPGSIGEQVVHEAMQEARENNTGVLPSAEVIRAEISRREQELKLAQQKDAEAKETHTGRIRATIDKLFNRGQ